MTHTPSWARQKKFQHKKIVPRKKSKTRVIDSISNLNNMIKKQATTINKLRKKVTTKKKAKIIRLRISVLSKDLMLKGETEKNNKKTKLNQVNSQTL